MESVIFLEKISIEPPREKIYQRLGFKKRITAVSPDQQKQTDLFIREAASLIVLKGMYLRLAVTKNDGKQIFLSNNVHFSSEHLSIFLRECREAVFMGATAGHAVMDAIKAKTRQYDLAAAVVYDATASEMTDAALDWIMNYLNHLLMREGQTLLPRRFSAGYGDFHLENQGIIYKQLHMQNAGVKINPNFILIPEKSVTAIGGICR